MEDLKASIQTYQSLIVEKDTKLSEFKSKLESQSSSQRENELFEQLSVYKDKNNVSKHLNNFFFSYLKMLKRNLFGFLFCLIFFLNT